MGILPSDFALPNIGDFERITIVCHDQPDPDCLASALAFSRLVQHETDLPSQIVYGGELGHSQNRVFINLLDIAASKLTHETLEEEQALRQRLTNSFIVVVDTSHFGGGNCRAIKSYLDEE